MATHSSVLAWRIPGTGEPSGLLSMGLHKVGHDWSDLAAERLKHTHTHTHTHTWGSYCYYIQLMWKKCEPWVTCMIIELKFKPRCLSLLCSMTCIETVRRGSLFMEKIVVHFALTDVLNPSLQYEISYGKLESRNWSWRKNVHWKSSLLPSD